MAVVYQHRRLDDDAVFYIGIGQNKARAYSKSGRNKYWKNIVNKVGYRVIILIGEISLEESWKIEIGLISYYGRYDLGTGLLVNMTEGGEGSHGRTGSWLGKKLSPEHKEKLRLAKLGKTRPKHSDETKIKISQSHEGKIVSDITKEKLRIINTGKKHSEETKEKLRNITIAHRSKLNQPFECD
jgi:hypothetical protein